MEDAAEHLAGMLTAAVKNNYSNWLLTRNNSMLFKHPREVEKAARHVLRATTVIQAWSRRPDKPSVLEVAEKLASDAELSLSFAPKDGGGLSQVRIMVEINDRHALSIDHMATREVKRSVGFRASTSWTAEHASFYIKRTESRHENGSRPDGNHAGRVVLAYLDARSETREARDNLANALWAITAHPSVANEQALRDAFDAERATIGRIPLGSSA